MNKILITMGLPASGKTTFAKEYSATNTKKGYRNNSYLVQHLCVDEDKYGNKRKNTIEAVISQTINDGADEVIIDGLFLNKNDIDKVLSIINHCISDDYDCEIHYWIPNKDKCLHNDIGRRNQNSSITIKNSIMEEPTENDLENLKNKYELIKSIKLIKHEIITKPSWKVFSDENSIRVEDDHYLYSASWSLGGNRRDCWGGDWSISGDSQPDDFSSLDELLEKICQNISFLQYKNIKSQCVSVDEYSEHDYYGGCVEYARYRCDLEQLYNILQEKGLIDSK